jgi:ligand-binding sensor domain-containing protein
MYPARKEKARKPLCFWPLLAFALVSANLCVQVSALNPDRKISQYAHTAWRVQDGYFNGQPTSFAQTSDGYLWIGTRAGLMHFDGVRFVSWTPPAGETLPSPFITALFGAHDGSLWIGTSGGLAHWSNGKLETAGLLRGAFIAKLLEDRYGTVWITHTRGAPGLGGFCEARETKVRCYGTADGIPYPYSTGVVDDTFGNLWVAGEDAITRWRPGSAKTYTLAGLESLRNLFGIEDLASSKDGALWVGVGKTGAGLGLQQLKDGVFRPFVSQELDSSTLDVSSLALTRGGSLMIGTAGQGLYSIRDGKVDRFQATDGLTGNTIEGIYEDREGNLWVATSEGVDCFSDRTVVTFSLRQGLSADQPMSVFASTNGNIWIGNLLGLDLLSEGEISSIRKANGFPGEVVTSLFEEYPGLLWVGVGDDLCIFERGKFSPIRRPDGTRLGPVLAMTQDVDGSMWIEPTGAPAKLIHLRDRALQEEIILSQGKPRPTLAPDPLGGVWLVLPDSTLARYQHGKLQIFPLKPNPTVRNIVLDNHGWLLEAATEGVIGWRDGEARRLTALNGLPCSRIYDLLWDNRDSLWMYAECGLIEISGTEMRKWWKSPESKVKYTILDTFDGAWPGETPFRPSAAKSPDGRLWFVNNNVLQMVNPAQLDRNMIPPPVHVEGLIANRTSYSPRQGLRLPSRIRDLEIDYTALSFVTPKKVFFRYMLEGHDTSWQAPGTRRQAFYTDLPPGPYRFRVVAANNDGVWNETGDALIFSIAPTYYQTAWFRLLCFAAGAAILWLLYLIQLKQATAQIQERLGARLEERERIARELHDNLPGRCPGVARSEGRRHRIPSQEYAAQGIIGHHPGGACRAAAHTAGDRRRTRRPYDRGCAHRSRGRSTAQSLGGKLEQDHRIRTEPFRGYGERSHEEHSCQAWRQ